MLDFESNTETNDDATIMEFDGGGCPAEATRAYEQTKTYGFVSTRGLLDIFAEQGWHVAETHTGKPRSRARVGFQKHLVRLRNANVPLIEGLDGNNMTRPELVMLNSHDRSTSFQLYWGALRFACDNGLIMGSWAGHVRVMHTQRVADKLAASIGAMMDRLPAMLRDVTMMARKRLAPSAVGDFTRRAYAMRLAEFGRMRMRDVKIVDATPPLRRVEDEGSDAYTVFNRVQEACIRGGIAYTGTAMVREAGTGERVARTVARITRPVRGVLAQVGLNQKLHGLIREYTEA